MQDRIELLTAREKETLRLLLVGHDAKSIASRLGLSIHTVNERLRDARRKLGVASSREAARLLAQSAPAGDNKLGDKDLGVAGASPAMRFDAAPGRWSGGGYRLAWLLGGMLMVTLIAAAVLLATGSVSGGQGGGMDRGGAAPAPQPSITVSDAQLAPARAWLALVDGEQWEASWHGASTLFQSHVTAAQWAAAAGAVRGPLGSVTSRTFQSATGASALPGVPDGDYLMLRFRTAFAHRSDAVETVTLAREGGSWKVAGYFVS